MVLLWPFLIGGHYCWGSNKVPIIEHPLALWGSLCSKVFLKEGGRVL